MSPSDILKESFTSDTTVHNEYVSTQANTYSPLGLALIAANNQGALGSSTADIMGTPDDGINHNLNPGPTGLFASIAKCEAVTTPDCGAFDDTEFSKQCGVCLDIGTNSTTKPATGGLVLLERDKNLAQSSKKSNFLPDYKPTVGSCPPGRMVSSKAECVKLKKKLECEKNGSYDLKDCAQCYSDTSYTVVDSDPKSGIIAGSGSIYVVGTGILSYSESGFSSKSNITLSTTPYTIQLHGPEATRVTLTVAANGSTAPKIAGYLSGTTSSGQFVIDLYRIVMTDNATGRKPRTTAPITVSGNSVNVMNPGFGKDQMSLMVNTPFTFVDPATEEASMCKDSPFITKQSSAEFLNSDPCYKKGSGPGKYNLECLQAAFLSNGCVDAGKAYPKDAKTAAALMTLPNGTFGTISDIATMVYNNAISASTGNGADGTKLSIEDWSAASEFCTGKTLTSPCDADDKVNGPLSLDCLSYLWANGGGKANAAGTVDHSQETYNFLSAASSLFKKDGGNRYCQNTGTLAPIGGNGKQNTTAIAHWQKQGGVDNVKKQMKQIHENANSTNLSDSARQPYLQQCYGVNVAAPPAIPATQPTPIDIPSEAPLKAAYSLLRGIDRGGADISCDNSSTHAQCRKKCDDNPACLAYNRWTGNGCCLKTASAPLNPNAIVDLYIKNSTYDDETVDCIKAVENTGFVPRVTWGTTAPASRKAKCDDLLCPYFLNKYGSYDKVPSTYSQEVAYCKSIEKTSPDPPPAPQPQKWWDYAKVGTNWKLGPGGPFKTVTVSDTGVMFATSTSDGIFRLDNVNSKWRQLGGSLSQISAAAGTTVIGANMNKAIYRGDGNGGWVNIPGGASWTSSGVNTETWVVGTNRSEPYGGGFWVKDGHSNAPNWRPVGGAAEIVSVGTGEVWCVNGGVGHIYRWNGSGWVDIPGPEGKFVHRVAVSPNGKRIICVAGKLDTNGATMYAWNGSGWISITGTLYNIAICDTIMVGLTLHGSFWYMEFPKHVY